MQFSSDLPRFVHGVCVGIFTMLLKHFLSLVILDDLLGDRRSETTFRGSLLCMDELSMFRYYI
jgi:hypothetical protein